MNVPDVAGGQQPPWQQMVGPAPNKFLTRPLGPPIIVKDVENEIIFEKECLRVPS